MNWCTLSTPVCEEVSISLLAAGAMGVGKGAPKVRLAVMGLVGWGWIVVCRLTPGRLMMFLIPGDEPFGLQQPHWDGR